jgi:hypothetical protein
VNSQTVTIETDYHILETDEESMQEFEDQCQKLNIDLDYLLFEFI